ncbi:GL22392 [Drosophila persimilis]|uniref:GL22392 n=1 Tax=Drosophila persimilis TaxID=7234 RepID=B4HCE1_DROPE|nr:GL22392 [Drosophila persimilis]
MDNFQVPKVVNRHVLQAIYYFSEQNLLDYVPLSTIKLEVMFSMRNVNPVHDLEAVIESSVKNLTLIGVLKEAISASYEKEYALQLKPAISS